MNRMILGKSFKTMMAATAVLLLVTGCAGERRSGEVEVEIKGSDPHATAPAAAPSQPTATLHSAPNARGIVAYDGYEAAVARSGDTVASVADRIGLSASELGAYNGLSPTHPLRAGDELVLPPRPGGYGAAPPPAAPPAPTTVVASPTTSAATIETAPLDTATGAVPGTQAGAQIGAATPQTTDAAPTSQADPGTTGWSPDLAAAAIDRAAGFNSLGDLGAPPSSKEPLPEAPQQPGELASPQLGQYQTPGVQALAPAPAPRLVETITTPAEEAVEESAEVELAATAPEPEPPVELKLMPPVTGPVVVGFNQGVGRGRNDGIDFAAPANSPVVAAAGGEVALVSQSLGGLGTIVLLRHPGDYLTVYGRIDKVMVAKGDIVNQGQKIGVVSPSPQPRMHFEVRHGAESVDPERFF